MPRKGEFRFFLLFKGLRREAGSAGALADSCCLFVAGGLSPTGLAKCKLSLGLLKGGGAKVFIIGASSGGGEQIAAASYFCCRLSLTGGITVIVLLSTLVADLFGYFFFLIKDSLSTFGHC